MRFGSVCSGIEAASVAWHPLGWEAAWLSEIEPFPCAVLKHHYPNVPNHGDMTLLPEKILSGEVEAPDLFCGGTPCQAFSVAGLRNSLDDARGNLSLTFVGIANAIDHVRSIRRAAPAIVFWENVPGVLNTKDNAFGCFLGALAGESDQIVPPGDKWTNSGCVFGPQRTVAWRVLDAQYFGVAQRRRRVFVVASAREDFNPAEVLFEFEGVRRDTAPSRQAGQRIAPCVTNGPPFSCTGNERVEAEAMVVTDCGVEITGPLSARDYKDPGTDGLNKISAKMVPVIQEIVGTLCADSHPGGYSGQDAYRGRLVPTSTYAIQGSMIGRNDNAGPQGDGVNEELCFTQNTIDRHAVVYNIAPGKGELKDDIHVTDAHISKTIDASGSNPAMHQGGAAIVQTMAVRRLTPVECERLQGFPDNYTNIPWRKAAESPDGPRYKALGNSWAVPVVAWIGKRIQERITT
jgi:DNA (cytosine-5)-methyltransferase 1